MAAWNAMTLKEKKTAAYAGPDVWTNIRHFIETNF
jgi:hypothetical protein